LQVLIRIDWSWFVFVASYYPNETVKIVLLKMQKLTKINLQGT